MNLMIKRLISVCSVAILLFGIYGCAQTVEETSDAEAKTVSEEETESITDTAEQEELAADIPVLQEEAEVEEEIEYEYFNTTYLHILEEYERAWEDETYNIEELQNVAGVFITLADAKFRLGTKEKDYTLYYSMSDLKGDGIEELIIGIRGEDGIAPCFIYTGEGERIHITNSRTRADLVEKPTILYENGIIESTECVKNGMYRYNFYQLNNLYTLVDIGRKKLIDCYFYIEDSENGTHYYKGDSLNPVTEEEFWSEINDYKSMPQLKLVWHELEGFWEPDEDNPETTATIIAEEHRQSEKAEDSESKKDEPVTVVAKETVYDPDGIIDYWYENEYNSAGNMVKHIYYLDDGRAASWSKWEYDNMGNEVMWIRYKYDGSIEDCYGYEYDSAGNKVKSIWFGHNVSSYDWDELEYDSIGNAVKYIGYFSDGKVSKWGEYEYDDARKLMKKTWYNDSINFYWTEYEYDSGGNRTKSITYKKSDGTIRSWYEYAYDSEGNMTKCIEYNPDGSIKDSSEYAYGSVTHWIEDEHEYDTITYCVEDEYDSAGNLTKKIEYESDGSRREYEYITITPK